MPSFLLSKFIVPLHLAVIAGFLAWVQPGPENVVSFLPLSFLSLGFVTMMLLFPAARQGEDVDDARYRVATSIRRDYVFIFAVLAAVFVVVQTLNGPRDLVYVRARRVWEYAAAPLRGFPSCLDMLLSVQSLFLVAVVAPAVLAIRNSLGNKGRRRAVEFIIAVATILGLYGLYAYAETPSTDSVGIRLPPPPSFATFATKTEAGAFFLMNALAAFGLLFVAMANDEEESDKFHIRFLFMAFIVSLASALFSLSCISIAVLCVALAVLAAYILAFVMVASLGAISLSALAATIIIGAAAGFLHFVAYPENRLHDCAEKIFSGSWQTEAEIAEHNAMTDAAWRMFADNAVGGVGASCFGIKKGFSKYIAKADWPAVRNPNSPHWRCGNDLAQMFAEHGAVGTAILLLPFAAMAVLAVIRVFKVARRGTKYKQGWNSTTATEADRIGVFEIMPPDALALFLATGCATGISFFVPVFGSHLNVLTWAVFLSAACASLPKPRESMRTRR